MNAVPVSEKMKYSLSTVGLPFSLPYHNDVPFEVVFIRFFFFFFLLNL